MKQRIALLLTATLWVSCGASSTFNQIFVGPSDKARTDVLIERAQALYKRGDLRQAEKLLLRADGLSPNNHLIKRNLAFVYLGRAELSLFELIPKIIKITKDSATNSSTASADILGKFQTLLNLESKELDILTQTKSTTENPIITGTTVHYPTDPGSLSDPDSPRSSISTLLYINKMLTTICPFTTSLFNETHTHERYQCEEATGPTDSLFLFLSALGHFVEAIAFNAALTQGDEISATLSSSGLFKRTDLLAAKKNVNNDEIGPYLNAIAQVNEDIAAVLDTSEGTLLQQMILNLNTAVSAFRNIPSLPANIISSAEAALDSIKGAASSAGDEIAALEKTTNNFKNQINRQITQQLGPAVTKLLSNENITEEQKVEACQTYEGIAGTQGLPNTCPEI